MTCTLCLVGGTGQRVGAMLGYLNILGAAQPPDRVFVVDADDANAKTLTSLLEYGRSGTTQVTYHSPYGQGQDGARVNDLVAHAGSRFWEVCVEPGDRELGLNKGFYARPQLASLVYNADPDPLRKLCAAIKNSSGSGRPVVIVGSLAGGTGAGLIPSIARRIKETAVGADQPVVGLIFTNYLQLPPPADGNVGVDFAPTTDQLEANSYAGMRHLLDLLKDADGPFDALYVVGTHPAGARTPATDSSKLIVHPHPAFLIASATLADGGSAIQARLKSAMVAGAFAPRLYVFPSQSNGTVSLSSVAYDLHQVTLPAAAEVSAAGGTSGEGLRNALRPCGEETKRLAATPFGKSFSFPAMFTRVRCSPPILKTLRAYETNLMRAARQLETELGLAVGRTPSGDTAAAADTQTAMQRLREYFDKTWGAASTVTETTAESWREVLRPDEQSTMTLTAQRFAQSVARSQIERQAATSVSAGGTECLAPLSLGHGHVPSPCAPLELPDTDVTVVTSLKKDWRLLSKSIARPDSPRDAFAIGKDHWKNPGALQEEWKLLQGLACGYIKLEAIDCDPSDATVPANQFERALASASGTRFHLWLSDTRSQLGLGGFCPDKGPWPAWPTNEVRSYMTHLADDGGHLQGLAWELQSLTWLPHPSRAIRSAAVLRMWCEDTLNALSAIGLGNPFGPWFARVHQRALRELGDAGVHDGNWPQVVKALNDHIATVGPLTVLGDDEQPLPLYFYSFVSMRKARMKLLWDGLKTQALNYRAGEAIDPVYSATVAHFAKGPPNAQGAQRVRTFFDSGYGLVSYTDEPLPMREEAVANGPSWLAWQGLVGVDPQVWSAWVRGRELSTAARSPAAPDQLWLD